jgi:hypothetical protein
MTGGVDQGPCLSYWKLSYRRKMIRTLWGATLLPIVVVLHVSGSMSGMIGSVGCPRPVKAAWWWAGWCYATFPLQLGYNYYRWHRELAAK